MEPKAITHGKSLRGKVVPVPTETGARKAPKGANRASQENGVCATCPAGGSAVLIQG